jgi:PhnO protein
MYRKATFSDCARIYDLICDMERRELPFDRFRKIYRDQLINRHFYCLVNDQDGRVIAVLNMRFEEQLHHAEFIAEIMEFAVEAAFRNQGIGKAMLEEACRIAGEQGCSQIEVACNQLRKDTHRFYLREGMHNFHYKFSKSLAENDSADNVIGK